MSIKGIIVVANTQHQAASLYRGVASGSNVQYRASQSGDVYAVAGDVNLAPDGSPLTVCTGQLQGVDSPSYDTNASICVNGCQKFVLCDDPSAQMCPNCGAPLATDSEVLDMLGYQEPDNSPVFCGTSAEAQALIQAIQNGGNVDSVSTSSSGHQYNPFDGTASGYAQSLSFDHFHVFKCLAGCTHDTTVSGDPDVVFCAHCGAPLQEDLPMARKVEQPVIALAPSLSAATIAFSALVRGCGGNAVVHDADHDMFISNSRAFYNPYSSESVVSTKMASVSSGADLGNTELEVHAHVCSSCGMFSVSSSDEVVFCAHCSGVLSELGDTDHHAVDGLRSLSEDGDSDADDSDVDDLDSDLAELDDDDDDDSEDSESGCASKSGDDEDDEDYFEGLNVDDSDDVSLSADDYDIDDVAVDSGDDEDDSEEDEDDSDVNESGDDEDYDLDLDEDDSEDDEEDDYDSSESGDDDLMLDDDEADDIDYEGGDADELDSEFDESNSSVISVSSVEALMSSTELDSKSLSCVYDGGDRWHLMHKSASGTVPVASLSFTDLSVAFRDEDKARALFYGTALSSAVLGCAKEHGVEEAIKTFGFQSYSFDVNVHNVVRERAEAEANARAQAISSDIESLSGERMERYRSALASSLQGLTRSFWQDKNPVAESLINKVCATGVSRSAATELVHGAFAEHGDALTKVLFGRADYLTSQSLSTQNEIARAIHDVVGHHHTETVEQSLSSFGRVVDTTEQNTRETSVSSDAKSGDFASRLSQYL